MSIRDNIKKGSAEMLILALLMQGDKYGYELSQTIGKRSSSIITMPEGSLYPALYKLEKDGFVSTYEERVGRRNRVYYHIEESGRKQLKSLIDEYEIVKNAITDILKEVDFEKEG